MLKTNHVTIAKISGWYDELARPLRLKFKYGKFSSSQPQKSAALDEGRTCIMPRAMALFFFGWRMLGVGGGLQGDSISIKAELYQQVGRYFFALEE